MRAVSRMVSRKRIRIPSHHPFSGRIFTVGAATWIPGRPKSVGPRRQSDRRNKERDDAIAELNALRAARTPTVPGVPLPCGAAQSEAISYRPGFSREWGEGWEGGTDDAATQPVGRTRVSMCIRMFSRSARAGSAGIVCSEIRHGTPRAAPNQTALQSLASAATFWADRGRLGCAEGPGGVGVPARHAGATYAIKQAGPRSSPLQDTADGHRLGRRKPVPPSDYGAAATPQP